MNICEQCEKNPLRGGRDGGYHHQGLRVCQDCYYACVTVTCEQIGKVLRGIRHEVAYYERRAIEQGQPPYREVQAESAAKAKAEEDAYWEERRRKFWGHSIRAGYD
jgi:hypothetical protein